MFNTRCSLLIIRYKENFQIDILQLGIMSESKKIEENRKLLQNSVVQAPFGKKFFLE
jgi:hypothetical protein